MGRRYASCELSSEVSNDGGSEVADLLQRLPSLRFSHLVATARNIHNTLSAKHHEAAGKPIFLTHTFAFLSLMSSPNQLVIHPQEPDLLPS